MKRKYGPLFVIPIIFFLDVVTKNWIVQNIPRGELIPLLPNFFDIVHVTNKGAAFGFLRTMPETVRDPFFFIVSLVAIVLILIYYVTLKEKNGLPYFYLALILGGASGNLWDRVIRGEVIDFLSFHWYDEVVRWQWGRFWVRFPLEWPAFNVADSAITVAVIGFILFTFKRRQDV